MGGMLALRYALMYQSEMTGLVVANPRGLEDWKPNGVPFATVDQLYERELKTSFDSVKNYQQATYYAGEWKPRYYRWVKMLAGMYAGEGAKLVAWNQARTSNMIFSQPVVHELDQISTPTVLLIGQKDTTTIGKDRAAPEIANTLGDYSELGCIAHQRIKSSTLVTFAELGHSPLVQDPARFNKALLEHLRASARFLPQESPFEDWESPPVLTTDQRCVDEMLRERPNLGVSGANHLRDD